MYYTTEEKKRLPPGIRRLSSQVDTNLSPPATPSHLVTKCFPLVSFEQLPWLISLFHSSPHRFPASLEAPDGWSFTVCKRNDDKVDLKIKMNVVTYFIGKNIFALNVYIIFLINDMFILSFILLFLANISRHNKYNFKTVLLIIHWVSAKFQWCQNDRNMLPFHYPYPKISYRIICRFFN